MAVSRQRSEWRDSLDALRQFEASPLVDLGGLHAVLRSLLQASLAEDNRKAIALEDVSRFKSILGPLIMECSASSLSWRPDCVESLTSVLKLMRNLCAGVPRNQEMILEGDTISQVVGLSTDLLSSEGPLVPMATTLVQTVLQLVGNVCVRCAEGQRRVWPLCFPDTLRALMLSGSAEVTEVCCMVIHTCTCENKTHRDQLCRSPDGGDVIAQVLGCLATSVKSEWMVILLESLVSSNPLENLWETLERHPRAKITLLNFTAAGLADSKDTDSQSHSTLSLKVSSEQNLIFLAGSFQRHTQLVLSENAAVLRATFGAKSTNVEDPNAVLVQTTVAVLRLLCAFVEQEQWLTALQQHLPVCKAALALLTQVASMDGSDASGRHRSRLASAQPTGDEDWCPVFGLKKLLVQLIGNMCYRNPVIQDMIREEGAIPLILNQCSIDYYNPYITQWAVLAVRNLCEGNTANQKLIASLEHRGVENTQALLEFGCEVEIGDDGKIKVKQKRTMLKK